MSRRGVVAGCLLGIASAWNIADVGAVASDISRAYGISLATVGLFTTALFVSHAAIQIPGGRAADRFGALSSGIVGMLAICAGNLLALTGPDLFVALVARLITGVGTGLAFIAGIALVREAGGSPFAQGLFGGIGIGAGGIAVAVMPQLVPTLGWRAPFWSSLALSSVALAVTSVLLAGQGRASPATDVGTTRPRARGPAIPRRELWPIAVLYSATYGLSVVAANWVVELLQRNTALSDQAAAAVGALTLLLGIVTRPAGGWIIRTHPTRARPAAAASLVAGAAGTLALVLAGPTWLAVCGAACVGTAAGLPFAVAMTAAARARPEAPAAAVGAVNASANLLVLVGTPLVGLTFALPGEGRLGFVVIGALWLTALLALSARGSRAFASA